MGFVELFLIGVGLSMDAFAVSICKGLGMKRLNMGQALVIGLFFGGFQALMPLIGWALGTQLADFITPIDHWIAFILLALIGGKMLFDAFREGDEGEAGEPKDTRLDLKELLMLAIATSIDALAVGRLGDSGHRRDDVRPLRGGRRRGACFRRALREGCDNRGWHRSHLDRLQDSSRALGNYSALVLGCHSLLAERCELRTVSRILRR